MRNALSWLIQGCEPGDSLVFHYSGHGSRQRNHNGDEIDGYDETLCPLDFETQGMMIDDEINATIVKPLPVGVKLHAIIDSCHSGTVLDLPFLCRINRSLSYSNATRFLFRKFIKITIFYFWFYLLALFFLKFYPNSPQVAIVKGLKMLKKSF